MAWDPNLNAGFAADDAIEEGAPGSAFSIAPSFGSAVVEGLIVDAASAGVDQASLPPPAPFSSFSCAPSTLPLDATAGVAPASVFFAAKGEMPDAPPEAPNVGIAVDAALAPNTGAGADERGAFAPNDETGVDVTPPDETGAPDALSAPKVFRSPALVSLEEAAADDGGAEDVPNLNGCDDEAKKLRAAAPAAVVGVVLMPPVAAGVAPPVAVETEPPKDIVFPAPASFDVRDKAVPSGLLAVPAKAPNGDGFVVAVAPRLLLELPAGFGALGVLSLLGASAACPRHSAGVGAEKENCGSM